jgi:hypothetical protein
MKLVAVTSFSQEGYDLYGKKMVQSFVENVDGFLIVYTDAPLQDIEITNVKVSYRVLNWEFPEQVTFEDRHQSPICHGQFGGSYDYRFDAVKFSHKPAAIAAASRLIESGEVEKPDVLMWLDGDTLFKAPLPVEFLNSCFPAWAHIGTFTRDNNHMEGGIIMMRYSHENVPVFTRILWECYAHDQVFRLPAWTDCHVMDVLIEGAKRDGFLRHVNLGDDASFFTSHPIVNSPWFQYVDHLKGARKEAGQSFETDFLVKA